MQIKKNIPFNWFTYNKFIALFLHLRQHHFQHLLLESFPNSCSHYIELSGITLLTLLTFQTLQELSSTRTLALGTDFYTYSTNCNMGATFNHISLGKFLKYILTNGLTGSGHTLALLVDFNLYWPPVFICFLKVFTSMIWI